MCTTPPFHAKVPLPRNAKSHARQFLWVLHRSTSHLFEEIRALLGQTLTHVTISSKMHPETSPRMGVTRYPKQSGEADSNKENAWKVDVRQSVTGNLISHDARPVHQIITMRNQIRASRLPIKHLLSGEAQNLFPESQPSAGSTSPAPACRKTFTLSHTLSLSRTPTHPCVGCRVWGVGGMLQGFQPESTC